MLSESELERSMKNKHEGHLMQNKMFGPMTTKEKLKVLLLPDLDEIILFIITIIITITIFQTLSIPYVSEYNGVQILGGQEFAFTFVNPTFTFVFGFVGFWFFAYRWGFSSIWMAHEKRQIELKNHSRGVMLIARMRFLGLLLSVLLMLSPLLLDNYTTWVL